MKRLLSLPIVLLLALVSAASALAQDPAALGEGVFEPVTVQAAKDGVVVRSEPGFLYKELRSLDRGAPISVNRRQGGWLGLRSGGWVSIGDVADGSLPLEVPSTGLRVLSDGVRLRSGPGTDNEVVGKAAEGDEVVGLERQGDWWRLESGGWVFASLVAETGPVTSSAPRASGGRSVAPSSKGQPVRRWSYMDLNGTLFEIFEIDPRAPFLAGLRQAMRETGVLEDDWTYLRLAISVQEGQLGFRYSPRPEGNPVSVVNDEGNRFGSVFVQGPVDRIPMHLRGFFQGQVVNAGERFEGLLMFRPTLDPARIKTVQMLIGGRARTFFESR